MSPLTNGTAYAFTVTAANLAGSGPASSPSSPVTPAGAPGAPTGVSAAPGNAQALVSFTPPASNGSAITGYTVTSYSSGGATGTDANAGSTSTAHTVTGLTNGIAYTFTVTATNVAGTSLPSGASTPVTPYTTPGIPTGVNATAGNAQATISFSAPASTGGSAITFYTVTSSAGQTASGSSSPITVTGLINGTGYTFTVTATNAAGTGQASSASNQVTPGAVPGAPTAVSATAGNAQATVTFTAPALTGGAITGYTVTSSPSGGLDTGAGTTSLSHLVTGLTNGTAYTFTVTATNAVGPGPASNPSSPVTPAAAPGAPTGVSATAGNAQAQVFFTPPASNGGSVITGYTVTSNSSGGAAGTDANAGSTSTAHTVTGLTNGIAYTFTVTATNSLGTATSSPSSPVTPYTAPGAPTIGTATAGNAQVSVTFSIPTSNGGNAITGYTVTSYFNGVSGVTASGPSSPITVSPLTPGIAYTFTVMATNAAGNGQPSGYSNPATPYALPGAPTGASATAGNGNATVTFTAAAPNGSAITGYTVTSNPSGGLDTGAGSTSLSHLVTGLTNGTAYTFTVTATNAAGNGPASNASTPVTPAAAPGAPTAVTATAGNAQALVSFTPPASNGSAITGYTVTSNSSGGAAGTDANAGSTSTAHTVTGLTNGIAYTFTVTATNVAGTGLPSGASNPVTPAAVPGAPTIGTATAGNAQATVSFTAPTSTGGSAITGYTVTSNPSGGFDTGSGTTSTTHIVTGLTNGTLYTFTVTAANAAGNSLPSGSSNGVTPNGIPGAPTGVTATAGNAQALVTFSTPASNGGSAITGYTVTSYPAGGADGNAGSTSLSHTLTGLANGTPYTFTVTATNADGTGPASGASNPVTPAAVPGPPTGVSATAGNAQAAVSFTPPASTGGSAITGYTVTSSPPGGSDGNAGTTSTTHTVTGLTNGTAYTFTVTAANAAGNSLPSGASNSVTPAAAPGAPTIGTATAGNAQATVIFMAPTSTGGSAITGYTVISNPAGGLDTASGTTSTSHTVIGLTNGTGYTFTVTATNAAGTGPPSSASSLVTPSGVPGPPTGISATAGNTQASVSFTPPASTGGSAITGYTVTSYPAGGLDTGSGTTSTTHTVSGLTNGKLLHIHGDCNKRGRDRSGLRRLQPCNSSRSARTPDWGERNGRQHPGLGQFHAPRINRRQPHNGLHSDIESTGRHRRQRRNNNHHSHRDGAYQRDRLHIHGIGGKRRRRLSAVRRLQPCDSSRCARRPDNRNGNGRQRPCDGHIHAARIKRRQLHRVLHRDIQRRADSLRAVQPDNRGGAYQRDRLHLHGDCN